MATKTKINLLSQDDRGTGRANATKTATLALIGFYILILILLFGVSFFFSYQEKTVQAQNASLVSKISSLKKNEEMLLTLKDRVSLSQVANSQSGVSPSDSVQKIVSIIPQEIKIRAIRAEKDGTTTIICNAANSKIITDFFKTLKDQKYVTVYLTSFSMDQDGTYNFSISLN